MTLAWRRQLQSHAYQGPKLDQVCIDEVQDLTLVQLALLLHICSDPAKGFVFAGDPAQTISREQHHFRWACALVAASLALLWVDY
jgi:hypothetical protein